MAIGSAIERGSYVQVYDEHGRPLFGKGKGTGPNDGLLGFTSATVTIRFGATIFTYDEHGVAVYAKGA